MLSLKILMNDIINRLPALMRGVRRAASIAVAGVVLGLVTLPAYAHDDAPPTPPTASEVAAAGRTTTAILALLTGGAVFYGFQRHRALNYDKHPPEWDKKMGRSAILFAILSAIAVGGVTAALSRPPSTQGPARSATAAK